MLSAKRISMSCQPEVKKVAVIGLGYIGLPTAAAIAAQGVQVVGVDVNQDIVDLVNQGRVHIEEPGLEDLTRQAARAGALRAASAPEEADVFIIAVPTPFKANHEPDLSCIQAACRSVAKVLKKGDLVILESTSPVGATEKMSRWLAESRPDLTFPQQKGENSDVRVAHCPERVLPGQALRELRENDRVIGGMTPRCSKAAADLYSIFVSGECVLADARTAEMCKLIENSYRDVNIAFANEVSMICDTLGIDAWELIRLANRHPRVGILNPGCGVGGHCIAVDPWFIVSKTPVEAKLISTARAVNDDKPHWVIDKVEKAVLEAAEKGVAPENALIACFGLAFKPNVEDLRESPALFIAETLYRRHGERLLVVDPFVKRVPESLRGARLVGMEEAFRKADVLVFLTGHEAFQALRQIKLRPEQSLVDACGFLSRR